MITVKGKLARGLNVFTRPQVVSLIIVTAVFLILFKESIQTTTIIVGFCSVAAIGEDLFILLDRQHKELLDAIPRQAGDCAISGTAAHLGQEDGGRF